MNTGKSAFLLAALAAVLPLPIKRAIYRHVFKWDIDSSARIGVALIWAKQVSLAPHSRIGNFGVLRNLELLKLGEGALIGRQIRAHAIALGSKAFFAHCPDRFPALIVGKHAALVGRHILDCSDTVSIGDYATVAGRDTLIYTHGIDITDNRQECAPVSIGKYCMVGARCMFVKGAALPDYSILGAQSVLTRKMTTTHALYGGNPASLVKQIDKDAAYFSRREGRVD